MSDEVSCAAEHVPSVVAVPCLDAYTREIVRSKFWRNEWDVQNTIYGIQTRMHNWQPGAGELIIGLSAKSLVDGACYPVHSRLYILAAGCCTVYLDRDVCLGFNEDPTNYRRGTDA